MIVECPHDGLLREMSGDIKVLVTKQEAMNAHQERQNGNVANIRDELNELILDRVKVEAVGATVRWFGLAIIGTVTLAATIAPTVFVLLSKL